MQVESLTSQEVPEVILAGGYCQGEFRQYELKRLHPDRVKRSLAGAVTRANSWPCLMISTCSGVKLPEFLETLPNGKGADWSLFEAYSRGVVEDGLLECFVNLKDDIGRCVQVLIPLAQIGGGIIVSYCEKEA